MADNGCAFRLNDVTYGAHRIAEVLCVIFLVTTTKNGNKLS
ncbi:Uncharacterised protein [Vibrio cholerae]|nr:Uncharacterised protein [Vibrio cholerae]